MTALRAAHVDGLRRSMRHMVGDTRTRGARVDAAGAAIKRGPVPTREERMYERMLLERVTLVSQLVETLVLPFLTPVRVDAADSTRVDADPQLNPFDAAKAKAILRATVSFLSTLGEQDKPGVTFIGQELEAAASAAVDKQLTRLFTIPIASAAPTGAVAGWAETNAQLITSIPTQMLSEVGALIDASVRGGKPIAALREEIRGRYGVTSSRASLIARDQTAKLTSKIQETRHRSYGITDYLWSTSGDSRVRARHAALDGRRFTYASPPVADDRGNRGHPGELWQCRCIARPMRPQDDVAVLQAEARARQEREAQILNQSPTVQGQIENRSGFSDWNRKRLEELKAGGQRARRAVGL